MMAALERKNEKGSGKNLKVQFELPEDEAHSNSRRKESRSSIVSDASLDSVVLENNENGIDTSEPKHADNELPPWTYSNDYAYPSPVWSFQSAPVTQSPPSQTMSRPGYDSNRIPLSIFSSKPANPMAWSHTSNDSLFSIQAGNNSFSRDLFISGNKNVDSPRPDESTSMSTALHPIEEVAPSNYADATERHSDSVRTTDTTEETAGSVMVTHCESIEPSAESATVVLRETPEGNIQEVKAPSKKARHITRGSDRSDESLLSVQSFQFPVLAVDVGRKSSIAMKPEKQEPEKPVRPPSPDVDIAPTAPNPGPTNRWYYFRCCSSSSSCWTC